VIHRALVRAVPVVEIGVTVLRFPDAVVDHAARVCSSSTGLRRV
jgi:hypothetical protein